MEALRRIQVCLGVAVSVACVLKRTVLYIDSTGGLSASRLLQMVQSKACKMEEHMEALRRIQVRQVFSVFSLIEALQDLRSSGFHQITNEIVDVTERPVRPVAEQVVELSIQLTGESYSEDLENPDSVRFQDLTKHFIYEVAGGSGSVKVVIVDSVAAVLSPIIGGRQTEGLSLMMQLAGELRTMARDLGVAVLPSQISQEFDLGACNQPQDLLPAPRDNHFSEVFPSLGSRAWITSNSLNRCYRLITQRGRADYGQDLALGKSIFTTTEKTSLNMTMTPAEMVLATEKEPENTQTTAYFSLEPTAPTVSPAQEKTPDWAEQTSVSTSLKLSMAMKHLQEPPLHLPEKSQTTPSLSPEPASSTISTAQKKTSDWAEESISTSVKLSLEMEDLQPVASTPISATDWTTTTSLNLSLTETLSVPEENSPPSSVGLNDIIPTHEPTLASKPDLQSTLLRSSQQPAIQQAFLQSRSRNIGVQPQPKSVAMPSYSIVQQGQYCDDKVDVKGGTIKWPEERSSGSVLKYICPVGTYAYPVNWRVCVRGRWTLLRNAYGDRDTVVTCKPVTCVSPRAPEFGTLTPRHHVFRWNDTIEFSCYSGFVLLGSAQSTCQVNGRWSGKLPVCDHKAVTCVSPRAPEFGTLTPRHHVFRWNDTIEFSCYSGFVLLGSAQSTCQVNGRWSGKLPVCDHKDNFCSNPGVPFGGSRSGDFFEEGSVVKYTCDSKLVLRGSSERKCLLTGVWSGEEPQCQSWYTFDNVEDLTKEIQMVRSQIFKSAVTCVSPFAPEFGALTPRHHVFRWNDTIEFSCYSGFVLLGSAQSTCQVNGRWSGKLPVCDHKDNFCSNPGVPFGGSRSGDFFEEGSVVKYTCDSKLVLRGSSERKCLLTGVWSGEEPQCQSWYTFDNVEDLTKEIQMIWTHKVSIQVICYDNFKAEKIDVMENPMTGRPDLLADSIDYSGFSQHYGTNIYRALDAVLKSVQRAQANRVKWTIFLIAKQSSSGPSPSKMMQEIVKHIPEPDIYLDVFAIGLGSVDRVQLESIIPQKSVEEWGRQYTFYLPSYDTLRLVYSESKWDGMITKDVSSAKTIGVKQIILHPQYNKDYDYDMALLELAQEISYSDTVSLVLSALKPITCSPNECSVPEEKTVIPVKIGIVSYGKDLVCGKTNFMGYYSNVPSMMSFIRIHVTDLQYE
ncbi:UNVERIFIED_CONTAM: hypothetical protein FKN15_029101 [Acipenser sinensis]